MTSIVRTVALVCLLCMASVMSEDCTDNPPDKTYTCAEQKGFGKCETKWMVTNGFCDQTCGRCSLPQTEPAPVAPAPAPATSAPVPKAVPKVVKVSSPEPETEQKAAVVPASSPKVAPKPATAPPAGPKPSPAAAPSASTRLSTRSPPAVVKKKVKAPEVEPEEDPVSVTTAKAAGETPSAAKAAASPAPETEIAAHDAAPVCNQTALGYIQSTPAYASFATVVSASSVASLLSSWTTNVTVFLPPSSALAAAATTLGLDPADLEAQTNTMDRIVGYHVLTGKALDVAAVATRHSLMMESGDVLYVTPDAGAGLGLQAVGDTATVTSPNLARGCNWVIHGIDAVLLPMAGTTGINPAYNSASFVAGR